MALRAALVEGDSGVRGERRVELGEDEQSGGEEGPKCDDDAQVLDIDQYVFDVKLEGTHHPPMRPSKSICDFKEAATFNVRLARYRPNRSANFVVNRDVLVAGALGNDV